MDLLHPYQVCRAIYYGQRWRLKRFLRIPDRPVNPVVDGDPELAFERHLRICTLLDKSMAALGSDFKGGVACEIGCGDCLSTADLLLGLGFEKIYLIEKKPIVLNDRQSALLMRLASLPGLPNAMTCLVDGDPPVLNNKVQIIPEYFENAELPEQVDFIFSNDVIEHVEDLGGFFSGCARILKPGGLMLHKFDLSGHEFFEDPLPPLDFQTYPRWLYEFMFPKYRRAVGNFADTIFDEIRKQGLEIADTIPIRTADPSYLSKIWPSLRKAARERSSEIVALLDVVVIVRKPNHHPLTRHQ